MLLLSRREKKTGQFKREDINGLHNSNQKRDGVQGLNVSLENRKDVGLSQRVIAPFRRVVPDRQMRRAERYALSSLTKRGVE